MSARRPGRRRPAVPVVGGVLLAMALLAALQAAGCRRAAFDPAHPDIVLIVVDTLRADHLGAYGYDRPTSPHIDDLARRGTTFERAWSAAPWTLPSIMSIMTSRYPSNHRVENDGLRLAAEVPTMAQTLRSAGYATAGFVSHVYVTAAFGFDRGFERFEDFGLSRPGYRLEAEMEPTADRVTDAALSWVRGQGAGPLFLFVHYFDPHWPYDPPAAYRALFPSTYAGPLDATYDSISRFQDPLVALPEEYRRFLIDRYDGEVRFVDDQVGRLLEGIAAEGRAARTWVVLTADHGEEFKEHRSMGHGRSLYEETIHVPLILGTPPRRAADGPAAPVPQAAEAGAPGAAGLRVAVPVSGIDLFPTIARLAGIATLPSGLQGRSLLPTAGAPDPGGAGTPRSLVSETVRLNAYRKAVRQGREKLIHFMDENRAELYDLGADPGERHDLARERPEARGRLMQALFSEVDLLSGGWNLRWSSDGRPRRFQGEITTPGLFRSVVPLFAGPGRYLLERGNTLHFTDDGQRGASGISFTVAPYESRVTFYLMIDGRPLPQRVFLGGKRALPSALPFSLEGDAKADAAFARPAHVDGREVGYYLWRNRPAGPDQAITLDEEIRERLRSLGYAH